MRVEIVQVLDPATGKVLFHSRAGRGYGYWKVSKPPRRGECDVELEIPEEVRNWRRLESGELSEFGRIRSRGASISIAGRVVGVGEGEDPIVEIRVDAGIILVEIPERRSEISQGDIISFDVSRVDIYPCSL